MAELQGQSLGYKFRWNEHTRQDLPGLTRQGAAACSQARAPKAVPRQKRSWLLQPEEQLGSLVAWSRHQVNAVGSFSSHHRSDLWDPCSCWWSDVKTVEGT